MRDYVRSIQVGISAALVALALVAGGAETALGGQRDDTEFAGFGDRGVVVRYGYPMCCAARGMVVQPDGKILTAGYTSLGNLVMRFLPDGTVDTTFADGTGAAAILNPSFQTRATCVAVQTDGRIVVAGWANTSPANYMLARLTIDGHLDHTFGSGGWVLTDFSEDADQAYAVMIQADGKIIAAGRSLVSNDYDFSAARYNADGSLDTTFNGDGKITVGFGDLGPNSNVACYDATLDGSGRLVMAGGGTDVVTDGVFKIVRLTTGGYLDSTFNGTGKKQFDIGPLDNEVHGVAVAPDGKIVVVGSYISYPNNESGPAYAVRINPDGTFDNSFDGDGKLQVSDHFTVRDIAVRPDGGILMLGEYQNSNGKGFVMVKSLNADGSLDLSFLGGQHDFLYNGSGAFCSGYSLALLPDGRAVIYGAWNESHLLLRIWPQGWLDGGRQQAIGFPGWTQATAYGLVVQPDDKLVIAGTVANVGGSESDIGVARLLPDGGYDNTFGTFGRATFPYGTFPVAPTSATSTPPPPPSPSTPARPAPSCPPAPSRPPSRNTGTSSPLAATARHGMRSRRTRSATSAPSRAWAGTIALERRSRSFSPTAPPSAGASGPRWYGTIRRPPTSSATCPTPGWAATTSAACWCSSTVADQRRRDMTFVPCRRSEARDMHLRRSRSVRDPSRLPPLTASPASRRPQATAGDHAFGHRHRHLHRHLPSPPARRHGHAPHRARAPRDVPRPGPIPRSRSAPGASGRRPRLARVPALRHPGPWLRSRPLCVLQARVPGSVFLQGR